MKQNVANLVIMRGKMLRVLLSHPKQALPRRYRWWKIFEDPSSQYIAGRFKRMLQAHQPKPIYNLNLVIIYIYIYVYKYIVTFWSAVFIWRCSILKCDSSMRIMTKWRKPAESTSINQPVFLSLVIPQFHLVISLSQ